MRMDVYSLPVGWRSQRDRLQFFGKKTALQVHETGFTIEGLLPVVWFPILIRVLYRALCEWSMRTIPFSRITRCYITNRRRHRLAVLITTIGITLFLVRSLLLTIPGQALIIVVLTSTIAWILSLFMLHDYVHIEFQQPDGRACAMRLRMCRAGDLHLLFEEIDRHRLHQSAPLLAKVAHRVANRRTWWAIFRRKGKGPSS